MNDTPAFLAALGDVPCIADPDQVRRRSRDMTASFSPVLKDDAIAHVADVIVKPRDKADVLRVAAAAARTRMPLVMRGGGSANFGQGIPLAGGAVVDMTAMSRVLWTRGQRVRAEAGARLAAIDAATRPPRLGAAHALVHQEGRDDRRLRRRRACRHRQLHLRHPPRPRQHPRP